MEMGMGLPSTEIFDPVALRDIAQTAEALGFAFLIANDHVVTGGSAGIHGLRTGNHEPFGLYCYLSAVTTTITFTTAIMILPQRQTALVAKQAAEVDLLSKGRLRLGVGAGWHAKEYEALDVDFHTRGRRMDEQIQVMRALWTQEEVNFQGRWHHIVGTGISPLPVQQPIPLWLGGFADSALRRVAKYADGWIVQYENPGDHGIEPMRGTLAKLRTMLAEEGRDPATFPFQAGAGLVNPETGDYDAWRKRVEEWRAFGATYCSGTTRGLGPDPARHIEAIRRYKEALA